MTDFSVKDDLIDLRSIFAKPQFGGTDSGSSDLLVIRLRKEDTTQIM
jgi:hypothetical protein